MRNRLIVLIILFFSGYPVFAQLNLEYCHARARENYPLISQYGLIEQAKDYSLKNIAKSYLPQFTVSGQATYQSQVTTLPIDFTSLGLPIEIEALNKDQYKAVVEMSQLIWDGGNVSSQRKITKAQSDVKGAETGVNLYAVREKVNDLYFGILTINEALKVLCLKEKDVLAQKEFVESMFENGTAMQSDLDLINVELLNLEQKRTEQIWQKRAYCRMLSLFIHEDVPEDAVPEKPKDDRVQTDIISRPELLRYDSRISLYKAQSSGITSKNMPRISLFAQGGYGRPGLNMLSNDFDFYALGGVRLTWNLGNLYTRTNEKRLLETDMNSVAVERETFLFNTKQQLVKEQSEIEKYRDLLKKDDDIIALRARVKKAGESKYRNGIYQANELITDINAEEQARLARVLHEVQYLQSIYRYKYIQGNN